MQKAKLQNIEFLRIIFTTFVLCFHFLPRIDVWSEGRVGVEFFFILSGFFLVYTFDEKVKIIDFMKEKIARFLPLILLFWGIVMLFYSGAWSRVFADIFLLPTPGLHNVAGRVGVIWFVKVLFWVTLFYFYLMKNYERKTVDLIIGLIVFFSYTGIVSKGWGTRFELNYFIKVVMLRGLGGVGLGYFLARFYLDGYRIGFKNKVVYSVLEILLFLYLVVAPFNVKIFPNNKLLYVIGVWILVAMFIQKEGWLSKWLNEYSWTDISKYCLATYLLQGIVLRIFTKKVCNSYPEDLSFVWLVVLVVLCCWGFGVFGHYAVEVRGKRFMDYLLDNQYKRKKTKAKKLK